MLDQKHVEAITSNVAKILRDERENQKLSMTVVAERSSLSQPMVSLIERGLRKPTLDTLLRLSIALDLDMADVLRRAQARAGRGKSK